MEAIMDRMEQAIMRINEKISVLEKYLEEKNL